MNKQNKRREFIALLKEVTAKNPPPVAFLEYMVALYNSGNREQDYCETLIGLFQLYFAAGNFLKAADCLDRAAGVDPYQAGNQKRLDLLKGKIDQHSYNAIANRFKVVGATPEAEAVKQEDQTSFDNEPTVLEDFMLQAEIFIQYGLRSKAVERLERINKLFAREEEKNEKLRDLYINAGFVPKYEDGPGPLSETTASADAPSAAPSAP